MCLWVCVYDYHIAVAYNILASVVCMCVCWYLCELVRVMNVIIHMRMHGRISLL